MHFTSPKDGWTGPWMSLWMQTYKIMNNIDRIDEKKFFKPCKEVRTRGHSMRVQKTQCKSLIRRNTFSQRVVNDWNTLPDAVVTSGSINQFKGRLGRWWKNDPISEPGRSTLNVLNYKYKYFPPRKYLSTSTFLFGEMYLSTFRVLSKCT